MKKIFAVMVLLMVLVGCSGSSEAPTTKKETKAVQEKTENTVSAEINRPQNIKPQDPEAEKLDSAPAQVDVDGGKLSATIPAGTNATFTVGASKLSRENTNTSSVTDKIFNTPWWAYGAGALIFAVGLALAWFLKSPMIAVIGTLAGFGIITVFVLIEFYSWVFLIFAAGILGGIGYLGWKHYRTTTAESNAEEMKAYLSAVAVAIESASTEVQTAVKPLIAKAAKALGVESLSLKSTISQIKDENSNIIDSSK